MTASELTTQVSFLRTWAFDPATFPDSEAFRSYSPDQRYRYLERIGICCGSEPASLEAHVLGLEDARG